MTCNVKIVVTLKQTCLKAAASWKGYTHPNGKTIGICLGVLENLVIIVSTSNFPFIPKNPDRISSTCIKLGGHGT